MQTVGLKLNMIIAENLHLKNDLDRSVNHAFSKKILLEPFFILKRSNVIKTNNFFSIYKHYTHFLTIRLFNINSLDTWFVKIQLSDYLLLAQYFQHLHL